MKTSNSKVVSKTKTTLSMLVCIVAVLSSEAFAGGTLPSFANGGFEGYTGNKNTFNSQVPPGWTITGGTPDVFNAGTTMSGFTFESSSTGGDFLHGIGMATYTESAVQDALSGLVIGDKYEISFEQSISNSSWSDTGGYWNITFGSESQNSDVMALPASGALGGWNWQTMIFTATSTVQTLNVKAMYDGKGSRTDVVIDSFYLGAPGQNVENPTYETPPAQASNPNAVPVPGAFLLAGLGTGLVGCMRRRKSR